MELNALRQSDSTESVERTLTTGDVEEVQLDEEHEAGAPQHEEEDNDLRVYSASKSPLSCSCLKGQRMCAACAVLALIWFIGALIIGLRGNGTSAKDCAFPSGGSSSPCGGDVCSSSGMVATTNQWATTAAITILEQGGNAIDAAAAAQFALNVVQPQSTGIGGGCFFMIHKGSTGEVFALDGREEAPAAFHPSMFCKNPDCFTNASCDCSTGAVNFMPERVTGGHPVGVPGTLAAMQRALDEHGTLPLRTVMQPAISLARDGFPMYQYLYDRITSNKDRLSLFNASAKLFLSNNGDPIPVGSTFRNPDLANTFDLLASQGTEVFYTGQVAQEIVQTVQSSVNPWTGRYGVMTLNDMAGYQAVYRTPTQSTYRNHTLYGFPSPGSGGLTLGMILNILEWFGLSSYKPLTVEFLHKFIDAQDLAFADRNRYIGDADWVDIPTGFLDKTYARDRAAQFMRVLTAAGAPLPAGSPPGSGATPKYAPSPENFRHGTTHLSVMDRWGNTVSLTTTIEENMGSAVVVPGRGFLLNNELTDFDGLPADPDTGLPYANRPEGGKRQRRTAWTGCSTCSDDATKLGGKRPRSSMSPTIIMRPDISKSAFMAVGSPGGSRIIGTVLNVVVGFLDFGLTLTEATDMPRVHSRNMADGAEVEEGFPEPLMTQLRARNFTMRNLNTTGLIHGFVQSVVRMPDGTLVGKADTKRLPAALAMGL